MNTALLEQGSFENLRSRWDDLLLGPASGKYASPESLKALDLLVEATIFRLDSAMPLEFNGPTLWEYAKELRLVATSVRTSGSVHNNRDSTVDFVVKCLVRINLAGYDTSMVASGNWWEWTIGIPQCIADILLLLRGQIPPDLANRLADAIRHNIPNPHLNRWSNSAGNREMTSANLIDQTQPLFVLALLDNDQMVLVELVQVVRSQMSFVSSGEGLYKDGSYIFHKNIPYNGTYGAVFFRGLLRFAYTINKTAYDFGRAEHSYILTFASKGLLPLIVGNEFSSTVCGRAADRSTRSSDSAFAFLDLLIYAHCFAKENLIRTLADNQLLQRTYLLSTTQYGSEEFKPPTLITGWLEYLLIADHLDQTITENQLRGSIFDWYRRMLRGVYRSDQGWTAEIALTDSETAFFEFGANENALGYHSGNGSVWVNSSLEEPRRGFQNLLPSHVPGTTIDPTITYTSGWPWANLAPTNSWAGAVDNGLGVAAVTFDMHGYQSNLRAQKTWLFTPRSIVSLGSVIHGTQSIARTILYASVSDYRPLMQRKDSQSLLIGGWGKIDSSTHHLSIHEDVVQISGRSQFRTSVFIEHYDSPDNYVVFMYPESNVEAIDTVPPKVLEVSNMSSSKGNFQSIAISDQVFVLIAPDPGIYTLSNYSIDLSRGSILIITELKDSIKVAISDPTNSGFEIYFKIETSTNRDVLSHRIHSLDRDTKSFFVERTTE